MPGWRMRCWWLLGALIAAGCPRTETGCEEAGDICTAAGTGTSGFNGTSWATRTWLYFPSALVVDPDGHLVFSDFNNYLVRRLRVDGHLENVVGNQRHAYAEEGPALGSPLENVVDLDYDAEGTLWMAELHTFRVLAVRDGTLTVAAGTGEEGDDGDDGPAVEARFSQVAGVAVVGDDVLIADTDNDRLRVLGTDGFVRAFAGTGEAGLVDGPRLEAGFDGPQRMSVAGGAVYVADTGNNAIRRIDLASGVVETVAGTGVAGFTGDGGPAVEARLSMPFGVFAEEDGTLWIADSGNHRVRRVVDGVIETVVGTGESGDEGDGGPAIEAQLWLPADVLVDEVGDLWIADMTNSRVRRVVGVGKR